MSFAALRRTGAGLDSDVASARLRILIPARAVPGSKVTHVAPTANRRTLLERFDGARAAVLGKLFDSSAVELAAMLRGRGVKVIADYSDDHFMHEVLGPAYRALAASANAVVASSTGLAAVVRAHTSSPVEVIADPVEGGRGEPFCGANAPLKVLWFGHPLNLDTLVAALPQLGECSLTVMTAPGAGAEKLGHRFRPWSKAALFDELQACDAVVIPSNAHDPRKAVKSANRFTESIWAGRFVLAHPLPAYEALAAFGWVGGDFREGLDWLRSHSSEALGRIRAGQAWVGEHCTPQAIGRAWGAVLA